MVLTLCWCRASHGGGKSASVPPKISSPELGEVSVRQKCVWLSPFCPRARSPRLCRNVAPHSQPKLFRESPSPPLSPSSLSTASNSDSTHHRRSLSSDIASFRPLERRCTTQSSTNARTTPRETSQQQKTNLAKDDYRVDDLVLATHEGNWWPAIVRPFSPFSYLENQSNASHQIGDERNLPEHIIGRRYPTSLPVLSIPNRDPYVPLPSPASSTEVVHSTWRLASRIRPCAAHETIPTSLASADREAFQEALEIVNDHSQVEKWAEDSKKEWCGCGRGSNVGVRLFAARERGELMSSEQGWIECEGGRECERLWFHKLCVGVEEQEEPDFWMCEDCRKRATMAEKGKGKGKGRKKA